MGRLRRNIHGHSQDHHTSAPTRGRGDQRPRARATGRKNDITTWRLGRGHLHVPTGRILSDRGRISPRMLTKEKPLRLKTSAEDVVVKVQVLHLATWLPPIQLRPMHVHSEIGR